MNNKFLSEKIGEHWCDEDIYLCPDYSSDTGFIRILNWAKDDSKHDWTWDEFILWAYHKWHDENIEITKWGIQPSTFYSESTKWIFTPDRFGNILERFLREKEDG